jgi:hypothetical protein
MAEPAPLNSLRFVDTDVERRSAWGPGEFASRQIEVDGQLLGDYLSARAGRSIEQSTPMVDEHSGAITPAAYLRALLGGPKDDPLPEGRIAIGYCDACLDASCGILLGATLSVEGTTVLWSAIGFDLFDEGEAPKLKAFWKKAAAPEPEISSHATWAIAPFEPQITLRFARDDYLETIQAERRRLAATL